MKNPNGYGCIKHLSGSRRNPFIFVITENHHQKVMGYFPTKIEALAFQVAFKYKHHLHHPSGITFAELYTEWKPKHAEYYGVSASTIHGYESAYKHCLPLYNLLVSSIKYFQVQAVIDDMQGLSYSSKKKVRSLLSLLFCYARKMEYTSQDFSGLIHIGRNTPINPHHLISKQKVNKLWAMLPAEGVDIILILLYTGMRNGELRALKKSDINKRQKYISIKKSKTISGVRTIPIHSKIWPLIEKRLATSGDCLISTPEGNPYSYSRLNRLFRRIMKSIHGERYKLHDTRHTCATWLDNAEVNENARKMILGHSRNGVTNAVYTHKTLHQLRKAIEKI